MHNYQDCLKGLLKSQDADHDKREQAREDIHFIADSDGQWEQTVINRLKGRPRYTFDKTSPVVDLICGEIESNDFGIKISPADGNTSKEQAQNMTGIIRGIENDSSANDIYNASMRRCVISGFDAWRVVVDWKKDTFEQEARLEVIPNAIDRVWFGCDGSKEDMSDSKHCWVLSAISPEEYKERWPDGSGMSVGEDNYDERYWYKRESVIVGEYLYAKKKVKSLVLFNNQNVVDSDDTAKMELMVANGFTEVRRRKTIGWIWYSRMMDGKDYLDPEVVTVFKSNPVVPTYGNFDVVEDKIIYSGAVRRLVDPQRVHNYAKSRAIEEGALAPRKKYWMTPEQAAGHTGKLASMNTNSDPIQLYNHIEGQLPPTQQGNNDINPHLTQLSAETAMDIESASGMYGAMQGQNPQMQSGVAIELQQMKGDTGNIKWHNVLMRAIKRTAEIFLEIIPDVYDTPRSITTVAEDGSISFIDVNQTKVDPDKVYKENSLKDGQFNVVVDIGAGFNNLQKEAVAALIEVAAVKPDILDVGADILLKNINAPDMQIMAERYRDKMVQNGMIPQEQLTEEEIEKLEKQQANQQPDPNQEAMQNALNAQAASDQADVQKKQADAEKAAAQAIESRAKTAKVLSEVTAQDLDNADRLTDQVRGDIERGLPNMSDEDLNRLV